MPLFQLKILTLLLAKADPLTKDCISLLVKVLFQIPISSNLPPNRSVGSSGWNPKFNIEFEPSFETGPK